MDTKTITIREVINPHVPFPKWGPDRSYMVWINPTLVELVELNRCEMWRFVVTPSGDVLVADAMVAMHRDIIRFKQALPYDGGDEIPFCGIFRIRLGAVAMRFQNYGPKVAMDKLRSRLSTWQSFIQHANLTIVGGQVGDTW